jgi:phosphoribosylglycinamide formyltransferase-1
VDTGPIVHQVAVPVRDGDTPESLAERILETEHEAYVEGLRRLLETPWRLEGRRWIPRSGAKETP